MENTSPFLAIKRTENQLNAIVRQVDIELLSVAEKKAVTEIRHLCVDARLDIRDYELSETREDQLQCAKSAKKRLERLEASILAADSVFGTADVAQLSAELEQISNWLR